MKIAIGCDHGGFGRKAEIIRYLNELGHEAVDFGCASPDPVDYPDTALPVCEAVLRGQCQRGILLCGTGIGMSIAANKIPGIRCALCTEGYSARLTRQHNDSNVLAMGARTLGIELMKEIVRVWLETEFIGSYHTRRIEKITRLEQDFRSSRDE